MDYAKWTQIVSGQRLPMAVVDLDAFDRNLSKIASIAGGKQKKLRVATKSLRVPELIRRVLKSSSVFEGLMCFSAEEAAYWASQGVDDLLVAYPTVQDSDLQAMVEVHRSGKKITLVVDSDTSLEAIAKALSGGVGTKSTDSDRTSAFRLVIDVDMSLRLLGGRLHLGVRRSPVRCVGDIQRLMDLAERYPQVKIVGVMAYEAQVAGLGDRNPFKKILNPIAKIIRKVSMRLVSRFRRQIAETFKSRGIPLEIFNGGGTGSLNLAAEEPWLTELSAGSALYCPHLFDYYSNIKFEPACFFVLQAVRQSDTGFITCQGGGYIASGEPGWDRLPVPVMPTGLKLVSMEGCGEVQTPLTLSPHSASVSVGSPVFFRHSKAGELAERFNSFRLVSNGSLTAEVKTYRGLGLCFF